MDASSVRLVDVATSICIPQANLLDTRSYFAAAGLPDGRVICAGDHAGLWIDGHMGSTTAGFAVAIHKRG